MKRGQLINILFVSPNSPLESVGGVERYLVNVIEYSKKQTQFKTIVLLPTSKGSYVEEDGGVVIYFDKNIDLAKNGSSKLMSGKAQKFAKKVEEIILKHKIDIICAENFPVGLPPAYSILLNMVAVRYKTPLVLRMHSFAASELQTELINQLMWNKISCVSKSVAGDCFRKGADIDILSTDYLGVNTSVFNNSSRVNNTVKERLQLLPENKVVLTATRIIQGRNNILQAKGLINLVQAFSKLSPRHPDLRLVIAVAKAPDRLKDEFDQAYKMLLGYIKLHNIEPKTIVKTFMLDEIPEVYKASDVFVLASENETFGQVFIEAMSSGLPVIGTKVGGIPEIISDSYNGYLIPPNDVSSLAQKIEKLVNDQPTRGEFIRAGIKTISNKFTLEKQLGNFIIMLREAV
jgi:glycosyltransferase involved in cell wall biosynthesis